jgi:hypothetical protein
MAAAAYNAAITNLSSSLNRSFDDTANPRNAITVELARKWSIGSA